MGYQIQIFSADFKTTAITGGYGMKCISVILILLMCYSVVAAETTTEQLIADPCYYMTENPYCKRDTYHMDSKTKTKTLIDDVYIANDIIRWNSWHYGFKGNKYKMIDVFGNWLVYEITDSLTDHKTWVAVPFHLKVDDTDYEKRTNHTSNPPCIFIIRDDRGLRLEIRRSYSSGEYERLLIRIDGGPVIKVPSVYYLSKDEINTLKNSNKLQLNWVLKRYGVRGSGNHGGYNTYYSLIGFTKAIKYLESKILITDTILTFSRPDKTYTIPINTNVYAEGTYKILRLRKPTIVSVLKMFKWLDGKEYAEVRSADGLVFHVLQRDLK